MKPTTKNDCETCIHNKGFLECDMYGCKYESTTKNDLSSGLKNGSPIIDWNNCHTPEQLNSIATTKNNLGVDAVSRKAVQTRLEEIINEMETIFADIREREVNDSVCGLCEYDCDHGLDGYANECPGFEKDDCFKLNEKHKAEWLDISNIPSVTPKEPFINKPCVSNEVCEHDKQKVLDKIRAEIVQMPTISFNANDIYKADVLAIIDKYKAESEG